MTFAAAVAARARTLAADLLEQMPTAYCAVMSRRHPEWILADADTDLVIEGYQSCGNTFARDAMEYANPQIRIASHAHSWTHVARGVGLGKPVIVLLRNPLDAVASHMVRMRLEDVDRELRRYHRFYRHVAPMSESVVLAPFETTVTGFGDVIAHVNARFSTRFNLFDHRDPAALAAVFGRMELVAQTSPSGADRMWRIARPSAEREEATRAMRARLAGEPHRRALARCQAVYEELLRAAEKAAGAAAG